MTSEQTQNPAAHWQQTARYIVFSIAGLTVLSSLLASSGCQQFKEHFTRVRPNNPVVGPAPPRLSLDDSAADTLGYANLSDGQAVSGDIQMVSLSDGKVPKRFKDTSVVAVVNGNSILASDVFAAYARQLEKMKAQLTEEQYTGAQLQLLQRDLPAHIERMLLSHALKSTLKQEQIDKLDQVLDDAFGDHVVKLMEKTNTGSTLELEQKLQSEGTSLADIRQTFGTQQLAMQYLATETQVNLKLGRVDLLNHYQANIDQYSFPTRIKWQEIRISITPLQERKAAIEKLNEVVKDLQSGLEFSEVAKKHSDGPTAALGGMWDWTKQDSLADEELNELLFSMKVGQISRILESPEHFRILRIAERENARVTPFEELQDELRQDIMRERRREKTDEVITKLKTTATIQTIFDEDPELYKAMRNPE